MRRGKCAEEREIPSINQSLIGDAAEFTSVRDGSAVAMESTLRVQQGILGRYLGDALVSTNEKKITSLWHVSQDLTGA